MKGTVTIRNNKTGEVYFKGDDCSVSISEDLSNEELNMSVGMKDSDEEFIEFMFDIQNEKEHLDIKVDSELRKRGWVSSSSHPGSLWLWTKTHNGITYSVSRDVAIYMEKNTWNWG